MRLIFPFLFTCLISATEKYPADSLIKSNHISYGKKISLLPIAAWQRISYNSNLFNCQFYPSCSNYGASAIRQYGLVRGGIVASERITRCNPFAIYYHLELNRPFYELDGRLIDPVNQKKIINSKKSPLLASLLSIIPGLGRFYSGRILDGLTGVWTFYLHTKIAYHSIKNDQKIAPVFVAIAGFTYFGEIYGAWRSTAYYQKKEDVDSN